MARRAGRPGVEKDLPATLDVAPLAGEPGKRAFWRQKREGADEYIEGEGTTIEYDGKSDRVKFIGRAEMRRYRGAVLADQTQGGVITYENTTDVFTVDGAALGARQTPSGSVGGRVRAVLSPRAAASAAPAAASPLASPAAPLRPSTTLGGTRQ